MHEYALAASLIRLVEAITRGQHAARVVEVRVRLGALCGLSAEHFREQFGLASRGTPAEGARLVMEQSQDPGDPNAGGVMLEGVELASDEDAGASVSPK